MDDIKYRYILPVASRNLAESCYRGPVQVWAAQSGHSPEKADEWMYWYL